MDFSGGSDGKASVYNAGDPGSVPGSGRSPGEGNGQSTPVLLPGKSHGQRSLVGYSPWGHKESDMAEQLHFLFTRDLYVEKASGGDGIPVELFQILKDDAVKVLHSICQQIWKTQQWPQAWKRSVFIQSQRKAMSKNAQTTAQLHSYHMLAK